MRANRNKVFLAILFVLSIALLGCSPITSIKLTSTLPPGNTIKPVPTHTSTSIPSPAPTSTATPLPIAIQIQSSAQSLALRPEELGDGWFLDAEVNDLNASYYFDRGEDGKAIIGTHRTTAKPPVDPSLVDSISMRGFSQPEKRIVLFQVVTVFKEVAQAEETYNSFLQDCDPPCEYSHQYDDGSGEHYVYQNASIADESVLMSIWMLPETEVSLPFGTGLLLRNGQVFMYLLSIGQWDDLGNAPPVSKNVLEALVNSVSVRIP